jgi:hypothetical protein
MWWNHLKRLIALDEDSSNFEGFNLISSLKTGEGVVFCPLGLVTQCRRDGGISVVRQFGRGCLVVKIRRKLTIVTGQSILSQSVGV